MNDTCTLMKRKNRSFYWGYIPPAAQVSLSPAKSLTPPQRPNLTEITKRLSSKDTLSVPVPPLKSPNEYH